MFEHHARNIRQFLRGLTSCLLAVVVNTSLNLIDAATYGRILFPIQAPLFAKYDYLGIALFLSCTATSQLVIALFSSFRRGATACAMVENIPFYHSLSFMIATRVVDEDAMLSTVLAAYFAVTIMTALIFLGMALLSLDRHIHKFPRVVLVGSMGGIGLFLISTAFEMATGSPFNLSSLDRLFSSWVAFGLWFIGLSSAITAIITDSYYGLPFVIPSISMALLVGFYLAIQVFPYTLDELCQFGWLMSGPSSTTVPVDLLSKLSLSSIDGTILLRVFPTILAAAIFGSVHVPINVPSYSRLTNQPFSMKRELYTQAIANITSAFTSFIPSYFVYTNSLLFLKAGAIHRLAGVALSITTALFLLHGMSLISYIPSLISLFWIFYLGLCLMGEALISYSVCTRLEYALVMATVISMTLFGFLPGIVIGALSTLVSSFLVIFLKRHSKDQRRARQDPAIQSPAITALTNHCREHCLVLAFPRELYFGNTVDQMQKLSFASLSCRVLLLDFYETHFMDLNAREALLAHLTSGLLLGQSIVILGLGDEKLKRKLLSIAHVRFSDERPCEWIHRLVSETVQRDDETEKLKDTDDMDDEAVRLIILAEGTHILNEDDWHYYEELRTLQESVLLRLKNSAQLIRLRSGEPLAVHHAVDGILILQRGQVKQRTKVFGPGAWVGLEEYLAGTHSAIFATSSVIALLIPKSALDSVPLEEWRKLSSCSTEASNCSSNRD